MASSMDLVWTGVRKFVESMEAYKKREMQLAAGALYREGNRIMTRSKEEFCPVISGTLRGSGLVLRPEIVGSMITVLMGYGGSAAPYALSVHENPNTGQTRYGSQVGQWKYLSQPFNEAKVGQTERLAADMRR